MKTPFFSRREVLSFLLSDEARSIASNSKGGCWWQCWRAFFPIANDLRDDGSFLEFQRVCDLYGYGPYPTAEGTWTMWNPKIKRVA